MEVIMSNYLFETHLHTAEVSKCSLIKAKDAVRIYRNHEYDGMVVTDHMSDYNLKDMSGSHTERMDFFLSGYRQAKEEGERIGFQVLLGMELTYDDHPWDTLVYGIDEQFLYDHKDLTRMPMEEFKKLALSYDLTLVVAHPYRYQDTPPPTWYVDGVEVFNGNPRHDSRNHLAQRWAKEQGLFQTAGSDYHELGDDVCGIYIPALVEDSKAFAKLIREPEAVTLALPEGALKLNANF